jgi:hypothetical protein
MSDEQKAARIAALAEAGQDAAMKHQQAVDAAYRTVLYYQQGNEGTSIEESIIDLVADLLTLADQDYGYTAAEVARIALERVI